MDIRSLGLRSDLSLLDAEFCDRGEYLVVRSPQEPQFYWGNLLVFSGPPDGASRSRWEALFAQEFADLPGVEHMTFTWDLAVGPKSKAPELAEFQAAGYEVESTVVLTAKAVTAARHPNQQVEIRPLASEAEWLETLELQVLTREEGHSEASYRAFAEGRLASLRRRVRAGQGLWYAAFERGRQVASLGIFWDGGAARFQTVITHPNHRRQGICGTLVHHVGSQTLSRHDVDALVMLADTEYHAARIYESVGFAATETIGGVCRWPRG